MSKKHLKTLCGSPVVPETNGAIRNGSNAIGWWWFIDPSTKQRNYIAIEDIRGGLEAIHDFLGINQERECPF